MTLPLKGLFVALATVTIWAVFLVGTRFAVSTNFTVEEVLLLRLGTGFLVTIPLMLKLGVIPRGQSVIGAVMLGLGASALFPYIVSMGLFFAPASDAGVLAPGMLPFWTALVMVVMTGEQPSKPRLIGLIVIFIGALMVGLWQVLHGSADGAWRGHILFLSGSFLWAIYSVYFKQSGFTPLHGLVIGLFWGTLAVAPFLALSGNVSFAGVSPRDFLVMALL
ncbi:MAG: EamA family transporter [Rhodobacteraceae bacterium]|nr:EamA family transporter [Paracoccaceae bacterium]